MPDSIEASEQMVSNWNQRVQQQAARYQAMASRVEELSITERSPDSAVQVTISSRGILTNLTIAESAQGKRMAELSAQIMSTVQRAQSRIPELLQQAMAETIGTEDQTANKVLADASRLFPEPPAEEPPAQAPPTEMQFRPPEDEATPPPPPPARPAPPTPPTPPAAPRKRPPGNDDDDDFGGKSILS